MPKKDKIQQVKKFNYSDDLSSDELSGSDSSESSEKSSPKTKPPIRFFPYSGCRLESKKFSDDFSDRGPGPIC